jgi:hypothetical protein
MRRILLIFLCVFLLGQIARGEEQKISQAYEDQLLERVRSVFSTEIPQEAVEHPICATSIFLDAQVVREMLSAKGRAELDTLFARPKYDPYTEYTFDSPAGHFKIHYAKSGPNAVYAPNVDKNPLDGVPDYVNRCAEFFDYAWIYETDTLGYRVPPSDYFYPDSNGGDGKLDVYLEAIGYLGYTVFERQASSSFPIFTSYIGMLNDFSKYAYLHNDSLDLARVTASHEFFHAIQGGYDAAEYEIVESNNKIVTEQYWMEMSATWMEDMVYDGVNDYVYYLPSFFKHPEWSLKTFGTSGEEAVHPYGACVWPIYLSEKFGVSIIKDIWYQCGLVAGPNVISCEGNINCGDKSATDIALQARGTTFEEAFREFTVWNYFTADRARTQIFYSEGDLFPKVRVDSLHFHTTYPVNFTSGPENPYGLGSNYVIFKPEQLQGGMTLSFLPSLESYAFKISAMGYNENVNEPISHQFQINPLTGEANAAIYNWTSYNEIIMIPAATSRSGNLYYTYYYSVEYDSSYHGEQPFPQKDWIGQNFPNPFVIANDTGSTYFPFILSAVSQVEIDIFAVSGEKVWHYPPPGKEEQEWTIGDYTERGSCPAWNGKNDKGEFVVSGIYLYQVKTKNSSVIKKLAVVR